MKEWNAEVLFFCCVYLWLIFRQWFAVGFHIISTKSASKLARLEHGGFYLVAWLKTRYVGSPAKILNFTIDFLPFSKHLRSTSCFPVAPNQTLKAGVALLIVIVTLMKRDCTLEHVKIVTVRIGGLKRVFRITRALFCSKISKWF